MTAVSFAAQLDQALKTAGVPIIGVSLGTLTDKTTWRVDFAEGVTLAHRQTAAQIITAFVPIEVEAVPDFTAEDVLTWCATKLGVDPLTAALEVASGIAVVVK